MYLAWWHINAAARQNSWEYFKCRIVSPHLTCDACRHDSQGSHKVTGLVQWARHLTMNQRHSLFGAWHHEDDTLPLTPPPLRLSRIVPLPSALPHPMQALSPLPAGFSAASALGRLPASPVMSLCRVTQHLLLCSLTHDETYLPVETIALVLACRGILQCMCSGHIKAS